MMMCMLEAGGLDILTDGIRKPNEDNPRGYYEFEAVKRTQDDASWLEDAPGKAVKMVYRLLYDLPPDYEYRILCMRRQMEEVLASQRTMLVRQGTANPNVSDEQLGGIFQRQLQQFSAWIEQQSNFSFLEVSYNELLTSPEGPLQ